MNRKEALEQLSFHSGRHQDIESSKWENGFLPSLKPYKGLNRLAFDNLMECLGVLKSEIQTNASLDKELILDLWTICHYSKAWGTDPQGMIRRNGLISDQDLEQLEKWIDQISYKVSFWLEGLETEDD